MSRHRTRLFALIAVALLAVTAVVAPRLGAAQNASPVPDETASTDLIVRGQEIYESICIACHRVGGMGAPGTEGVAGIPALADNPFVALENPDPVVRTILNGRAGMPSFRGFSDEEIAGVASYIRGEFNDAGPVDPALVTEIRAEYVVEPPADATPVTTPGPAGSATPGTTGEGDAPEAIPTPGQ
jgi:mono/diheme cytochrome c family protein